MLFLRSVCIFMFLSKALSDDRNEKKGVCMKGAQSCSALEDHTSSSWWYSWGTTTGYSFCNDPDPAAAAARSSGMDFVPMFWRSVPSLPLDSETAANLQAASYLLTFNEPEKIEQANLTPQQAADAWPAIVAIASTYNLQIVAPCTTDGPSAITWYNDWLAACDAAGSAGCHYDFTCIHLYYHASPCPQGVASWACIGNGASQAISKIDTWYSNYGNKPVWVTELACAPWGGAPCGPADHATLMDQLVPVLQQSDKVYRYAWYNFYDGDWDGNGLHQEAWEKETGVGCPGKKWIGGFGNAGWQIQTLLQCVEKAENDAACYQAELIASVDDKNCYCSVDACPTTESTYATMTTYRNVADSESTTLTPIGVQYNLNYNTAQPTSVPSSAPSKHPSNSPTMSPITPAPTTDPTASPSIAPSSQPSVSPTPAPTENPTATPSIAPSSQPSGSPTPAPTEKPTASPSSPPSASPTASPTETPTQQPSLSPTDSPTELLVWDRMKKVECPNKKWLTGFGTASWQIQTQQDCVLQAQGDNDCFYPLVLSIDDHNCYCSLDACEVPIPSHDFMETNRRVEPAAGACGPRPATWHCTDGGECQSCTCLSSNGRCMAPTEAPTVAPSDSPTDSPSDSPTGSPTKSPTVAPSHAPTDSPSESPTVSPTASPTAAPLPLVWSRETKVECPNQKWVTGFGTASWQIQTQTECIDKASSDAACQQQPLVLSMDDQNCYCSLDDCTTPVASHNWMETNRLVEATTANVCGALPRTWDCVDSSDCQSCLCLNGKCNVA